MHLFVYNREAKNTLNSVDQQFFTNGIIGIIDPITVFGSDQEMKDYYSVLVKEIYRDFTHKEYPFDDVWTKWRSQASLGEVHTVVLCSFLSWDCFLSDDKDAVKHLGRIFEERFSETINIYSRQNRCEYLKTKNTDDRCRLTSSELKKLSHIRE